MSVWFANNITDKTWNGGTLTDEFMCHYDPYKGDIYINRGSRETIVFNEQLETFTSFFDNYRTKALFPFLGETYFLSTNGLDSEFSARKLFGSTTYGNNYSITYRVNSEPLLTKVFTNGEYIADYVDNSSQFPTDMNHNTVQEPFDEIRAWNEYQDTGDTVLHLEKKWYHPDIQTKFRVKRFDIPRDSVKKRDRINNPWMFLKLFKNAGTSKKMQFHSLAVTYYK